MTTSLSVSQALQLALKYHRANQLEAAEQVYDQVLKQQPQNPEALYGLGILAQQNHQLQVAQKLLSDAVSAKPDLFKAWFSLGNVHQTNGELPEAESAYQQAIRLRPDVAPVYNNLGFTLQQQGKFEQAIACYDKALEIQPNCTEAEVNIGNALFAQNKLSAEKKSAGARANNQLGAARIQAGDFKTAQAYCQQAIAMEPDLAEAHHNLGVALFSEGKLEEAIKSYQQTIRLKPHYVEAYKNLGNALEKQEKFEEAANSYRKAIELKPDYAEVYSHLVTVIKKLDSISIWQRFGKIWQISGFKGVFSDAWKLFWMGFAGLSFFGRIATWLATWFAPPFWGRCHLSYYHPHGYISTKADIYHQQLKLGANVFIGDRVTIYQDRDGGKVELGDRVHLYGDTCIQTGQEGTVKIGADTHIQPRCQLSAYKVPIHIGCNVQIATNCAFYPYDHGMMPGKLIHLQPLETKGGITVDDGAWLGCGVIVLNGVRIGKGAVIGAGSVVNKDIPDGAIAVGTPARVVKMRGDLALKKENNTATVSQALGQAIAHYQANRLTEASQVYRQILEIQPNQSQALQGLGLVAQQMERYSEAQKCFSKLIKAEPNKSSAWLSLGNSHQSQGNSREAVEAYKKAIALQPDLLKAHYSLGMVLQLQGDLEAAIASYQRALELNPNQADIYLNLGKIYQAQNNFQQAIVAYRQALKLINPHYASAIAAFGGCDTDKQMPTTPPIFQEEVIVGEHRFPAIPQVADDTKKRPFWSVVLPIYSTNNRSNYLLECLVSVLKQWSGEEDMEIVVVDDASPLPLKELVDEIGGGIIKYYRNSQNRGAYQNFNTAVAIGKGEWIHLLHDDDYVLPGFYECVRESLEKSPSSVGAAFTGYENVDEHGEVIFSQQVYKQERGIVKGFVELIGISNPLNMAAVVVRRSTYEHLGGYLPELNYTGDWEFYKRVTAFYDWWYEPKILARYRQHSQNITTDSKLSGSKGTDIRRAIEVSENYLPADITIKSRHYHFRRCLNDTIIPLKAGSISGALRLLQEALKIENSPESIAKLFSWLRKDELSALRDEIVSGLLLKGLKDIKN